MKFNTQNAKIEAIIETTFVLGIDVGLAGLALVENSSGKHKGDTRISKRGRKRHRYLLFEVAMSLVAKNLGFREIYRYYTARKCNPLKKVQSLWQSQQNCFVSFIPC